MKLLYNIFFTVCFTFIFFSVKAQRYSDQIPQLKRYTAQEAVDPDFGIIMYNNMIGPLGGDSIRYNKGGYNLQGWQEDFYVSGKLLHKGFYADGLIKVFKNYYENGQVERNFTSSDPKRSSLDVYYPDGKVKSKINYYEGSAQKQYDFYANGNPEYVEENDKDMEFLYKRNSYFENGQPSSLFELIDKKSKKYLKKEFYDSGKIKEEGTMKFRKEMRDYQKDGEWLYYDENGKVVKKEKYQNGELIN